MSKYFEDLMPLSLFAFRAKNAWADLQHIQISITLKNLYNGIVKPQS